MEDEKHLESPEAALAFARELRNLADKARNRFYAFLVEVEQRPHLWNACGATFADYMKKTHLGDYARLERWKRGRAVLRDASDKLGFHATHEIARIHDESDRRAAVASMAKTYEKEGGVALSRFAASNAVKPYLDRPPKPAKPTYLQLQKENQRLREENKKLRARIRELVGGQADAAE